MILETHLVEPFTHIFRPSQQNTYIICSLSNQNSFFILNKLFLPPCISVYIVSILYKALYKIKLTWLICIFSVCVCVCVCTHTHTHTHTEYASVLLYAYSVYIIYLSIYNVSISLSMLNMHASQVRKSTLFLKCFIQYRLFHNSFTIVSNSHSAVKQL